MIREVVIRCPQISTLQVSVDVASAITAGTWALNVEVAVSRDIYMELLKAIVITKYARCGSLRTVPVISATTAKVGKTAGSTVIVRLPLIVRYKDPYMSSLSVKLPPQIVELPVRVAVTVPLIIQGCCLSIRIVYRRDGGYATTRYRDIDRYIHKISDRGRADMNDTRSADVCPQISTLQVSV